MPSHLARAAPWSRAPGIVLFSPERPRGAGTGYRAHPRSQPAVCSGAGGCRGALRRWPGLGKVSAESARRGRQGGRGGAGCGSGRRGRGRRRRSPRRRNASRARRPAELAPRRATLRLCSGSAPAAGGAVAAAEPGAPPPPGPGAPGAGRTPSTAPPPHTHPLASSPAWAGRLRLGTAGPPAAARIIPCAELPIRRIVWGGVEVERFGCWKAAMSALGNMSLGNGSLSRGRERTARSPAAGTAAAGGRVRACMYTAAADARVCSLEAQLYRVPRTRLPTANCPCHRTPTSPTALWTPQKS